MKNKYLVSVIIPTYSRPDNIRRAINSVLAQTYKNIEIIVVDDNGEGTLHQIETEAIIKDYIDMGKIIYLKHKVNKNGSAARNTGFKASCGEYINFLDDDDVFLPEKIEKQVDKLINNPEYGASYCNVEIWKRCSYSIYGERHYVTHNFLNGNILKDYITERCKFNTSAILFRRNVLEDLKGFDESWRRHQDYELMIRFFKKHQIICASLIPLMIYDQRSDRINSPNCVAAYNLEERFLTVFEKELLAVDVYKDVAHNMWYGCLLDSVRTGNTEYIKKTYAKIKGTGFFSLKEIIRLIKALMF